MKRVIQTYRAPEDWPEIPPGLGDFIRGACHLKELLDPVGVQLRIDISETEFFDLIEYDDAIFQIGNKAKIAASEGFVLEPAPLFARLNEFLASDAEELYIITNLGSWARRELPDNVRHFISGFYRFNNTVESANAAHLGDEPYEVLSIRYGHFQHEIDECGCNDNVGPVLSCIEEHILPNARHRIVVTSDSYELKRALAQRYGFIMLPHRSRHGAFGGALPVARDLSLIKNSQFNYHINAWSTWWSGFSHYTSLIFQIPGMNFRAPDFAREEVPHSAPRTQGESAAPGGAVTCPPFSSVEEAAALATGDAASGNWRRAKAICDELLVNKVVHFTPYYLLGLIALQSGQFDLAGKRLRQALAVPAGVPEITVKEAAARLRQVELLLLRTRMVHSILR